MSVVIPSGRPLRLQFALDALGRQTLPVDRFEVVVVLDPASSGRRRDAAGVRTVVGSRGGNIAALRNAGWRAARAPVVAFTDDDCRPAPDWLELILAAALEHPNAVIQGRTEPDPDEAHLLHGLARSQRIEKASGWYQTCNIAYPRAVLERLDGFDEGFAQIGEDADIGLRAAAGGIAYRFEQRALVWHAVVPRSLPAAVHEAARRDTLPHLIARHPRQREFLYLGVFWKRSHATLPLAVAGALVARRHPLGLAGLIPYVLHNVDRTRITGPRAVLRATASLAARAAVDAVEVGATIRGAARARTLVL